MESLVPNWFLENMVVVSYFIFFCSVGSELLHAQAHTWKHIFNFKNKNTNLRNWQAIVITKQRLLTYYHHHCD